MSTNLSVLSLFSSAGIGELGIEACGMKILLSNELIRSRCDIYSENFPDAKMLCGDIWNLKDEIISEWTNLNSKSPFLIYATPPCQGMSFNSVGKRLQEIAKGRMPKDDPRNQLIIPTVDIVKALRPEWILLENVPEMENTIIPTKDGSYSNIIEYVSQQLAPEYVGRCEVVNCADFGIPQRRVRLITIFTRSRKGIAYFRKYGSFLPNRTHSEKAENGKLPWVTLRDAISKFPPLSAEEGKNSDPSIPLHIVPVMKPEKFWWISHTPANETAYNNQCAVCGFQGTPRHGMQMVKGKHQSRTDTPIYCSNCNSLLPRPSMIDKVTGERRRIKGFDSAYRRMSWDSPAPTLTQNFQAEASDKKVHPDQNRVLSVAEALRLQTIDAYNYHFSVKGIPITLNSCCKVIGESVPPKLIELICRNILSIEAL